MKLELLPGEEIIREGRASLEYGLGYQGGKFYLTNLRIVFRPHFFNLFKKNVDVPLTDISCVEGSYSRVARILPVFPNAIKILPTEGSTLRVLLFDRKGWLETMQGLLRKTMEESKIQIVCPNCDRKLKAKRSAIGTTKSCPACQQPISIVVPLPSGEFLNSAASLPPKSTTPEFSRNNPTTENFDNGYLYSFYFPLTIQGWFSKLWWVSLLLFMPFINVLLMRGWRLELMSRIARGDTDPLPPASGIPKYLLKGMLLWTLTFSFTIIPMLIIVSLGIGEIVDTLGDIYTFCTILIGASDTTLTSFVVNEGFETIACACIAGLWGIVSSPLYRVGMIRHGISGQIRDFWNLPESVRFIIRHPWAILRLYTLSAVSWGGAIFLAGLLASTGFGALVAFLVLPVMYFSSTGYEYAQLARLMKSETAIQQKPAATPAHPLGLAVTA